MDATPSPSSTPGNAAWLITFTDLVALMLTFFVMLFAMSNVKIDRWNEMTDALSKSLNPARATLSTSPTAQYNISSAFRTRAINLDYLFAVLESKIGNDPTLERSRLTLLEDRLVISLPGEDLFSYGGAALSDDAQRALFALGGVLRHVENQLAVVGHALPQAATGYSTEWELSLARAIAVANALTKAGYNEDVFAYGNGASELKTLAAVPESTRRQLAQRIDIVLMPTARID